MMYAGGFFVETAEISKISSVNCGLYPFRNGISFFEILTLSPTLNFSFLYLVSGLSIDATIHCRHKLRQLVNEFFTMIFYVAVNNVF